MKQTKGRGINYSHEVYNKDEDRLELEKLNENLQYLADDRTQIILNIHKYSKLLANFNDDASKDYCRVRLTNENKKLLELAKETRRMQELYDIYERRLMKLNIM